LQEKSNGNTILALLYITIKLETVGIAEIYNTIAVMASEQGYDNGGNSFN
jgi:hypothetical protein